MIDIKGSVEKRINVVCEQTNHLPGSLGYARCSHLFKTNMNSDGLMWTYIGKDDATVARPNSRNLFRETFTRFDSIFIFPI